MCFLPKSHLREYDIAQPDLSFLSSAVFKFIILSGGLLYHIGHLDTVTSKRKEQVLSVKANVSLQRPQETMVREGQGRGVLIFEYTCSHIAKTLIDFKTNYPGKRNFIHDISKGISACLIIYFLFVGKNYGLL